jgi:hypothetical protein
MPTGLLLCVSATVYNFCAKTAVLFTFDTKQKRNKTRHIAWLLTMRKTQRFITKGLIFIAFAKLKLPE